MGTKMSFKFKVFANNPPTVLFVVAAFALMLGVTTDSAMAITFAEDCLRMGVFLQVLWIIRPFLKNMISTN